MRVIIAPDALVDLQAIADYIASDNPDRAASFVDELEQASLQIGERPRSYRLRPMLGKDIRIRFYQAYAIIYRIDDNIVHILRAVHGARNLRTMMLPEHKPD